ncbi:ABC transporter ATP-binding protein [Hutsoniella sourekii]
MEIIKRLQPYKWRVLVVILLTFGNALGELFLPRLMSVIVDQGVAVGNTDLILRTGLVMVVVVLLTVACRGSAAYHSAKAAMSFSRDLRHDIYTKVNHMTFDETESFGISSLITRTTDDVNQVEQMTLMGLRPLVRGPLMFIGGLIMAFYTNFRLSFTIIMSLPFLILGIWLIIRLALPYFPQLQDRLDHINGLFRQRLTGLRVIRAFGRDHYEEEVFTEANQDYYDVALRVNQMMITIMPILQVILNLALVGVLYFGSRLIDAQQMLIGDLMAYLQYITQVLTAFIMMGHLLTMIPRTVTSMNRINEVIHYPSREVGGDKELEGTITSIQADQLTFCYPGATSPVLEDIDFGIHAGQTLGIIGGTGSGKSTLLKLLLQFYEPTKGQLLINGQPIESLSSESLRSQISYVPQQNFFFTKSVGDNLAYSNEEVSPEAMIHNTEVAQARDFLSLEDPLSDEMIRGGQNFSGGQRQRLAIARALSRSVSVYIFDDSFSALDYRTDYELRHALGEELVDAMLIIVAQRVATIRHADKILVLDDGQVKGWGNHQELMASNTLYQEIARSQGEEDAGDE